MRRAFLSLYFIVATAIAGIGWGLDQLWDLHSATASPTALQASTLQLLEQQLTMLDSHQRKRRIDELNQTLDITLALYALDDLSSSYLAKQIAEGEPVLISHSAKRQTVYRRLTDSEQVIALTQPVEQAQDSWIYTALTLLFYLSLAGVILFWLWPLSRDLQQLEQQTTHIGKDDDCKPIKLRPGSPVQALANAFNRMVQRINELLAARKEMTYAVSHELRTPLARMKFALQMAQETDDASKLQAQLNSLHTDIDALDQFVNELLSYASFDQSEQTLNLTHENFSEVSRAIVEQLNVSVTITISSHAANDYLLCDWRLMELAITNLLQNGLRYARSQLHLTLDDCGSELLIMVDDDGPGISEDNAAVIFQPFVRLQQEHPNKGYGLGLAIVKRIMQWHGGSVTTSRSSLGGAQFSLRWPKIPETDQNA